MDLTRRELLSAGATAGLAGLAGCAGLFGGGGDDDPSTATETATATATPTTTTAASEPFTRWLPASTGFTGGRYQLLYYDLGGFRARRGTLAAPAATRVRTVGDRAATPLGVDAGALETVLRFRPGDTRVVTGEFAADAVATTLTEGPYTRIEGRYGDYRLLVSPDARPPVVALADGVALLCRRTGGNAPRAVARRLVDTERGRLTRYQERSELFAATLDPLVGATHVAGGLVPPVQAGDANVESGQFAGMRSFGLALAVGTDRTDLTYTVGFAETVPTDAVRTWATRHSDGLAAYENLSVTSEGRVARVTGTVPTDRVDFLAPGDP
jgi:hypothetical protein